MSSLFESFEKLDRAWDARGLEGTPLRKLFLWLLVLVFLLGASSSMIAYQLIRHHQIDWGNGLDFLVIGFLTFRYSRTIYQRIGN